MDLVSQADIANVAGVRFVDPRHGTHAPTTGTPARRRGSVRRTTTVDARRPEGLAAGVWLVGRGRDLLTRADGTAEVVAQATTEVDVRYSGGPIVHGISTDPQVEGIEALVGRVASTGFRGVIDESVAASPGSILYLLLDETPASVLVSGYAIGHAASRGELEAQDLAKMRPPGPALQFPDLCAGFRVGGVIHSNIETQGRPPQVTGPIAQPIVDPADAIGWHETVQLGANEMRRARRHDLWRDDEGVLHVDAFFRDSHVGSDGVETVIHEYTVEASVDEERGVVLACEATPRVLPWLECPEAAASAHRLVGMKLRGLRPRVRAELIGPSTCTHLNDTLRELEDVLALTPVLGSFGQPR
jgi:Protein of unknown function (DUF2889)